ncbi:hypothetical protein NIES37_35550 [Tolypothrix tenuis PCC 7101]|uniref:Leucine rich repeat variant n=1 Tax=Tolypothrix tenuis PCC 7101 TaxID=231146 RepID=A0A1Z4N1F7_9CYAN|nr:hypothetical protein [Aulosira sp. FACHB-113]BAY99572.1 hypothetical protein NIES37_35550 [Tolypothrix tenuis PCC 7101]BAZ76506.1 hypothetical protein NIES50_51040 [Aulosira laxa NIES-50]
MQVSDQSEIAVAKNLNTTPELLTELARHQDIKVRQAVAKNPQTPTYILFLLAEEFPQDFLHNPIFSTLDLENPESVIPGSSLQQILACDDAPQAWLHKFAISGYHYHLLGIVQNPQVSKQVLELAAENTSGDAFIHELIKMHVNIAGEMDLGWQEYAENKLPQIIAASFSNFAEVGCYSCNNSKGYYYQFILWQLGITPDLQLTKTSEYVQTVIAKSSETPPAYLRQFLNTKFKITTLIEVAKNKNTPVECLIELADHRSRLIREAAMRNPSLPRSIVHDFFQERFLATHPHTQIEKLRELCKSKWSFIRWRVAKHPNLELSDLNTLAQSADWRIRECVASHPRADLDILQKLAQDQSVYVRQAVALNSQTPPECLERLSGDRNISVRANVAKNPRTPLDILLLLYQNQDNCILQKLAYNPAIPQELQRQLQLQLSQTKPDNIYLHWRLFSEPHSYEGTQIKEIHQQAQYALATSAMTPIPQLLELLRITPVNIYWEAVRNICQQVVCNHDLSSELLLEILDIRSVDVYAAVAAHPHISDAVCERITKFKEYRLRLLMLQNPHIPSEFIEKSLYDKHSEVRQYALKIYQEKFANTSNFILQYNEAIDEYTPLPKLAELAKHKSVLIREAVAKNPRIIEAYSSPKSKNCLEKLAQDKNQFVQIAVANNSNTPIHILEKLANNYQYDHYEYICYQRGHKRKEHKVFIAAVKKLIQIAPTVASKYLANLIEPRFYSLDTIPFRLALLQHPAAPIEYLAQNLQKLRSFPWYERYVISQHPQVTTEILQILLQDAHRVVRAAATARLHEKS